jgi:phosphoribosylformylglycinamidine synthase II
VETAVVVAQPPADEGKSRIEVHLKPGVMDPVAASTEMAVRDMGLEVKQVRTGRAYLIEGKVQREQLQYIASRVLANGVVESIHFDAFIPRQFPAGHAYEFKLRTVPIRNLSGEELVKLSREGHLFLSLDEMNAIQAYFKEEGREPTDVELETLAQTWSEHCVHKTLKSAVDLEIRDEAGKVIERRQYKNLIKETIFQSTMKLMEEKKGFCLSVFVDNAGVIAFDETDAVCFKVETHNRPSAIDPYGGSATGIGGVIRDVLGTGLAAKPVANTDVFCVAFPDAGALPKGVIHPKRILREVVAGVRDYGNRMGIPTINGAVYFDDRYVGNPLVFCGCVGIIPRNMIKKESGAGDAIVVMGGRTGRDGIHGATFSSAELTTTHADEFAHAVQIGNAITEKKMTDVVLAARDRGLYTAITDCGAGGLSSAVGEMGEKLGAQVELDKVPLKYAGLRYDEIWISEAQERMVMSVPEDGIEELLKLAASEDVEATVIGRFGTENCELVLNYQGKEVGRMRMEFVHKGIPMPMRKAVVNRSSTGILPVRHGQDAHVTGVLRDRLLSKLAHPNIASKHWIIRQYDHEVQGGSVIKPLTGPVQVGPSDASVIRPKLGSYKGVVIACGLAPHVQDPYDMAIAAIDEAIRNAVCVGADPDRLAILDNFCWPGTNDEASMGALAMTCQACHDAALAYGIPFISGKDSLHNQFTDQETGKVIRIPNTLLISAIGVIDDVRKCITMDLKERDGVLMRVLAKNGRDLADLARLHRAMAGAIGKGYVTSCHDVSDGGWLTAAAEMAIASGSGLSLEIDPSESYFEEGNGAYVIEIDMQGEEMVRGWFEARGFEVTRLGRVTSEAAVEIGTTEKGSRKYQMHLRIDELTKAWRGTLDW